ncbi:MAG: hypothetical protein KTU85_05700 [Acidimicrobiia bacterium]|nr:hypothetical protein [Acidimicrobiia bacterium]MCY4456768.1 hypothetical protein [Acidimicrobiaceae bacterium]
MHGVIVPQVGELESQEDACAAASSFVPQILTGARSIIKGLLFWFWCWGGDEQWLYAEPEDRKLYSHDHGWYLPETGPTWDVDALVNRVREPRKASWPSKGLDPAGIATCVQRLWALKRDELAAKLNGIPKSWPVSDLELERVGWFLESRAPEVAARLESMRGAP